jgi:hypothetical protein
LGANETRSAQRLDAEGNGHSRRTTGQPSELEVRAFPSAFVLCLVLLGAILAVERFLTGNSAFYFFDYGESTEGNRRSSRSIFQKAGSTAVLSSQFPA